MLLVRIFWSTIFGIIAGVIGWYFKPGLEVIGPIAAFVCFYLSGEATKTE